ncbi:TMAO reductase system periplasmic protein TorT [Sulfitobacter mediterraneus]|uniref:Monosaccharide ABC transporter substrate-binding protein (CUT2 family) n=1 Tax=Sulfitobacter mediterraneus TaxID=83219 RepID=A0A2T6CJW4_9RHOB|nr:TMAO reductase system periplasmic protein TorT [Sulfitobacter mediterraneus]KIN78756.1 Periplasmic sensory protein associated with the TorRS two-component regulatory system [Sulfitobacter mediterraneus KCTC 32188]PTX75776.1 monosaccharide ABC transporter substrate-binding protein (CUT2 family) [Sulfitobacter mediterraneus]
MKLVLKTALALSVAIPATAFAEEAWFPYPAQEVTPAFSADGETSAVTYEALDAAEKAWNICVSFPHMKDAYWLGVDYGVTAEAERLGVNLNVVEAGGYTELARQISQIEDCVSGGADAIVVGAISFDGLNNVIGEVAAQGIPVIDVINGVSSEDISAKSLVSFHTMGYQTGAYLAEKHPAGSEPVQVGWFPGPAGAGWVEGAHAGFMEAVEGSAVEVLEPRFGDTGKETQLQLVEDVLQANPEVRYLAGTAVTAEAAQGVIRERGLQGEVDLLAFYMTPGVYTGIERGFILAAPADSMVIQGRVAIDQAVRILEGKDFVQHVGPEIFVVDPTNIGEVERTNILPPDGFAPVFSVSN